MPSYYIKPDYNPNEDPIGRQQQDKWFSLTPNLTAMDGLYDWCQYCLENFNVFHEMEGNVCCSCGRVAAPIAKPKQPEIEISSINDRAETNMQGTSMKIDYSENNDRENIEEFPIGERLQAIGLGQAVKKLEMAERSTSSSYRAIHAAFNERGYVVKTTTEKNRRGAGGGGTELN